MDIFRNSHNFNGNQYFFADFFTCSVHAFKLKKYSFRILIHLKEDQTKNILVLNVVKLAYDKCPKNDGKKGMVLQNKNENLAEYETGKINMKWNA